MLKRWLLVCVLAFVPGCAAFVPPPVPAPPPCDCWHCWLRVDLRQQWQEKPAGGCARAEFTNFRTAASVSIERLEYNPRLVTFAGIVALCRLLMVDQGYAILDDTAVSLDPAGRPTAGLHFRLVQGGRVHLGKVVFRPGKKPDSVLIIFGIWPVRDHIDASVAFDELTDCVDDLPPR